MTVLMHQYSRNVTGSEYDDAIQQHGVPQIGTMRGYDVCR